jgi:hypothetical protein
MNASDDYCELCDLPRSQCLHGQPPPLPKKAVTPPTPKKRPVARGRSSAAPQKLVKRRWTPPEVFKALIDEGLMTKSRPGVWQLARPGQHLS